MLALYAGNRSVLVSSNLSLLSAKKESILAFGVGEIASFRLVVDNLYNLHAIILKTGDEDEVNEWYVAWIDVVGESQFIVAQVFNLTDFYQSRSQKVNDVDYYIDGKESFNFVVSKIAESTEAESPYQIDFIRISPANDISILSRLNITYESNYNKTIHTPILVNRFIQAGKNESKNRTLIALHDDHIIHLVTPPSQTSSKEFSFASMDYSLSWTDPVAKTIVMRTAETERLNHISIFSEDSIRVGRAIPYVWLAYVTESAREGNITTRFDITSFPEFAVDWLPTGSSQSSDAPRNPWSQALISMLNPFGFIDPPCPWNDMMNSTATGLCTDPRLTRKIQESSDPVGQIEVRNIPELQWTNAVVTSGLSLQNTTVPALTVLFSIESTQLHVYGMRAAENSDNDINLEEINLFDMNGIAHKMAVSPNGLHVLPIVKKHRWELEAMNRYYQICELAKKPDLDPFEKAVRRKLFGYHFPFEIFSFE